MWSRKATEIDVTAEIKLEDLSLGDGAERGLLGAELESVVPPGFAEVR